MGLTYSSHAMTRASQRSIPFDLMDFLYRYGDQVERPGGALAYVINSDDASTMIHDLKSMIGLIEKARKKVVLVDDSKSIVITAYHRSDIV